MSIFENITISEQTRLTYAGARYYPARVGKWLSMDPLAHEFLICAPYKYVINNSICTEAMEAARTSETFNNQQISRRNTPLMATTPFSLMLYLENQINNNNDNIIRPESQ